LKDIKQGVEELGVMFEKFDRSPMESRVFAYLLLADPPHQSFDAIREFLDASKSAVSNALNRLQSEGTVHYITFSGDRKRYFKVNTSAWYERLIDSAKNLAAFNHLLEEVLRYRADSLHVNFTNDLKKLLDFQEFLTVEIEKSIAKWKAG
jgi:DNA-binding transcriptional regulator GbsR (MarR family)